MNIAKMQFNLQHRALEIYLSGCKRNCKGCHNPQLKDFEVGVEYKAKLKELKKILESDLVKRVWILGGEPLDQPQDKLLDLIGNVEKEVWVWTSKYDLALSIFKVVDYVKLGEYLEDRPGYLDEEHNINLASNNQIILKGGRKCTN